MIHSFVPHCAQFRMQISKRATLILTHPPLSCLHFPSCQSFLCRRLLYSHFLPCMPLEHSLFHRIIDTLSLVRKLIECAEKRESFTWIHRESAKKVYGQGWPRKTWISSRSLISLTGEIVCKIGEPVIPSHEWESRLISLSSAVPACPSSRYKRGRRRKRGGREVLDFSPCLAASPSFIASSCSSFALFLLLFESLGPVTCLA